MRAINADLAYNVARAARYEWYRMLLGGRLTAPKRGLLGRRSALQVRPGGAIEIGAGFVAGDDVKVAATGSVRLGRNVFINSFSRIIAHELVEVGDNVVIASYVSILDHDHRSRFTDGVVTIEQGEFTSKPIRIGSNVWLGDKVTVVKGVTIGDGVIVGANSVVTRDIEPGVVVGGIPAKVIRRFDDR